MKKKYPSLFPYRRAIPQILLYQVISKGALALVMTLYKSVTSILMWSIDRPAFTSGDLPYLLRTWQGCLLVLLGFIALVIYTVFDIHATILLSDRLLRNEKIKVMPLLKKAFVQVKNLQGIRGALTVLYVSLAAPLAGATFGISLTSDFVMPDFIASVIRANPLYNVLYSIALIALALAGAVYVFTFHFVVLGDLTVKEAMRRSRDMVRQGWKSILPNYLLYMLKLILLGAAVICVTYLLPAWLLRSLHLDAYLYHAGIIFFTIVLSLWITGLVLLVQYFSMMKLTVYYYSFTETDQICTAPEKKPRLLPRLLGMATLAAALILSFAAAKDFDTNFPLVESAKIIAHRGGGTLANENTILSLEAAAEYGAFGSEIDVQRSADDHYVINHDENFLRCCNDSRKPGEMSLDEIKELEVINSGNPFAPTTQVATIEEMLDAAKGRLLLFIELKGKSADEQMVRDIYQMVIERDMVSEVMMISLDYELIDFIETNYPEIKTGYLCYFSFGDIATLNCDVILMEAEVASSENIGRIHAAGKEAGVWTVNMLNAMTSFMASDIDYIITDEVAQADVVRRTLAERTDEARVLSSVFGI